MLFLAVHSAIPGANVYRSSAKTHSAANKSSEDHKVEVVYPVSLDTSVDGLTLSPTELLRGETLNTLLDAR